MSQLVYPDQGIYSLCASSINDCRNSINQAAAAASFDVPDGFQFKGYLDEFGGKINEFYSKIDGIDSRLRQTNDNFDALSSELEHRARVSEVSKVGSRERMIN